MNSARRGPAVGIDVGGTKIAAALVDGETGGVHELRELPTRPERGGAAVLADCTELASSLGRGQLPVGIGLCELVDLSGRPVTADTVDWLDLDVAAAVAAPAVVLESDVRAAARAEALFGAGAGRSPFLYVIVGTGASVSLVVDGKPYPGAHGGAVVLGAPPVERVASGAALARRTGLDNAEAVLADSRWSAVVDEAAAALGRVLGVLVNALDPTLVVIGGGLGGEVSFCERVAAAVQPWIVYPSPDGLEIVGSQLGRDAGVVGAALAALERG